MSETENFGSCMRRAIVTTVAGFALLAGSWSTTADGSARMNYQGRLSDSNGQPLATGNKLNLRISIWDGPTASFNQIGSAMVYNSAPVLGGYLNVLVGPLRVEGINDPERYIGIEIGPDGEEFGPEILPRQRILSTPTPLVACTASDFRGVVETEESLLTTNTSNLSRELVSFHRRGAEGFGIGGGPNGDDNQVMADNSENIYLRLFGGDSALNAEILADSQGCGAPDDTPVGTSSARTVRPDSSERALRSRAAFSTFSFTDCASQTEVPESECDALVAFYNSTNGEGWGNSANWLTGPIESWSGVVLRGDVLRLGDDRPAFVEVAGPGGIDPCGPGAVSTDGCAEVGGNAVFQSPNSTGEYLLSTNDASPGSEATIGGFAPNDYELRFTGGTSVAWHLFTTNRIVQVPFEVWDIGPTDSSGVNDPSDDVRMIPILFSDGGGECAFGYGETVDFVNGLSSTDRIYAYYPWTSYDDWETAALPLIQASPDDCPAIDFSFGDSHVDLNRGRPLQRLVLADVGQSGVLPAPGTMIRFYTKDVKHVWRLVSPGSNISGGLPPELGNLQQLEVLSFNSHQMTTAIPPELGNLQNLRFLELTPDAKLPPEDTTGLTGAIPPELGNLQNLEELYLNNNQLSGAIPPELGDLQSVRFLYLFDNQLTGAIPPELGDLQDVEELWLGSNRLSGAIPPELANLQNIGDLDLSGNQLSGAIPPQLGNMQGLVSLGLETNQLSGAIPPELGNLQSLGGLRLDDNQLSGAIPPELGNLQNLLFLNLENNQLSGAIPPGLGNLSNLAELSLSNNDLGSIVPLPVAALGAAIGVDCRLTGNLPSLIIPDTPEYTTLTANPEICGLPFSPLTCPQDFDYDLRISGGASPALHWDPIAGASGYDVIRGELNQLRQTGSTGQLGVVSCLANDTNETAVPIAPDDLDSGEPSFYLVRLLDGSQSATYGFDRNCAIERTVESGDCAITASSGVSAVRAAAPPPERSVPRPLVAVRAR